jgi:hypothetical protein
MRRTALLLLAGVALASVVASVADAAVQSARAAAPVFGIKAHPGNRDWRLDLRSPVPVADIENAWQRDPPGRRLVIIPLSARLIQPSCLVAQQSGS